MATLEVPALQVNARGALILPNGEPSEVWRDHAGGVIARGWLCGDSRMIGFPGLGLFEFSASQPGPVVAQPEPGARVASVIDTYRRSLLPLVLQVRGAEALHASGLVFQGGVVALCAVSGTGKSTLARTLSRRGHQLWADDAVVLAGTRVLPLPFQVKLRPASSAWFDEPALSPLYRRRAIRPLRGIVVLERDQSAKIRCERLAPATAFSHLIRHSYCFSLSDTPRKRDMISRYLGLAGEVPVFELRFPDGLGWLDKMAGAIEQAIGV